MNFFKTFFFKNLCCNLNNIAVFLIAGAKVALFSYYPNFFGVFLTRFSSINSQYPNNHTIIPIINFMPNGAYYIIYRYRYAYCKTR